MVNQQLLDYIREQLKAGVDRKEIKDVLLNVRWEESDIDEAFQIIDNESKKSDGIKSEDSNLINLKNISPMPTLSSFYQTNSQTNNIDSSRQDKNVDNFFAVSKNDFIPQKNNEAFKINLNSGIKEAININEEKSDTKKDFVIKSLNQNQINQTQPKQIQIKSFSINKKFKIIIYLLFGLVIAGLLGLVFFMYQKNNELENKLNSILSQSGDAENQSKSLTQTINDLQRQIMDLKQNNNILNEENNNLKNNLLLFNQSTSSLDVELSGLIIQDKGQYLLKTNIDILVVIKNSKDEKVKKVLDSFMNQNVKINGTRSPGLREVTVTEINNQSIDSLYQLQLEIQVSTSSDNNLINTSTNSISN